MTLPADYREAARRFAASDRVLVATDFDGVLAPLVLDPSTSSPLPGTIEDLRALADLPGTYAAVVSGRDLDTLTDLTGLEGSAVTRIGSHGGESSAADGELALDDSQRSHLQALTAELEELCAGLPEGAYLEHKPTAVVLHTRRMDQAPADEAEEAALELAARHTGLHVLHGKQVVEMSVVQADKGSALIALRDAVGAHHVAYFGDDVTDEHAFAALGEGDLTVKVGDGETAAGFRVRGPQDAAEALSLLRTLREGAAAAGSM
ncbi:trehalose-phosphatase [Pedococcus sp. KACC 23699]|uniref:Trehalose 6-phosphate phosphatase n=1 Tax=Pedococcus sp. KACC 23699 TaxID=3149228 RepID=A0AAU7JXL3_9MICO